MATAFHETEDKYDVDADAVLPTLASLPGVHSVDEPEEYALDAVYFDTTDLRLAHAGLTLRRRTGGADAGWHLKVPGDGARQELRTTLGRSVRTVPSKLRTTVHGLVRDQVLQPVAGISTRRTLTRLRDEAGTVLAEVCDDTVQAESLAADPPASTTWREWEVELAAGDRGLLDDIGELLRASGARPSASRSKLARTLARTLGDQVSRPGKVMRRPTPLKIGPARDLIHRVLVDQTDQLRRLDPSVRADLPEAVHDMRRAGRRLRSVLASYRSLLDRATTEPLRDELRWLTGVLGTARDLEVLHRRLIQRIDNEDPALVRGGARRRADLELSRAHREAHAQVVKEMTSPRYFELVDELDVLVADPPWTRKAGKAATTILPTLVRREWLRLDKRVARAGRATDPEDRAARLHEVRKAAKRARHTADTLRPAWGRDAHRYARHMKSVQDVLGDHHDLVVMQGFLLKLAAEAPPPAKDAFTYGVLYARLDEASELVERDFERTWRSVARPKTRRWLEP
jgi:CHAD domain-containing protein